MPRDGAAVTVSCTQGSRGKVYAGRLPHEETETDLAALPATRTRVRLPADGVGLARLEFIVAHQVKIHPMASCTQNAGDADRCAVDQLTEGYLDRGRYVTDRLGVRHRLRRA
ncbi:hypothetical protein AB4039_07115 [Streptomyces sp. M-16]|uniref:hypothetical protein n=1 Tax=Streptomyces sp. M-16 TaxID=3233040 RepID=UPI003F974FAD